METKNLKLQEVKKILDLESQLFDETISRFEQAIYGNHESISLFKQEKIMDKDMVKLFIEFLKQIHSISKLEEILNKM